MSTDYNAIPDPVYSSAPAPAAAVVMPAPAINLKLLKTGSVLFLACESDLYEMTVLHPEDGIVEISSNLPTLRQNTAGQFMWSVRWDQPGVRVNVIQRNWAMVLRFSNGMFQTQTIMSASVSGKREDGSRWSYEVF